MKRGLINPFLPIAIILITIILYIVLSWMFVT